MRYLLRVLVVGLLLAVSVVGPGPLAEPVGASETERAVMRSPFNVAGVYATDLPATHPTSSGDWAVDLYANGVNVYPDIVGATGTATLTLVSVVDACGTTGKSVTVGVTVDGSPPV